MNLKYQSKSFQYKENNKGNLSKFKNTFNNFFITKVNNTPKILKSNNSVNNIILNRNKLLEKNKLKEKENEQLKNNFFEFMSENTNYLDIEKFTEYFKSLEEKQKHKYDENLKKIEQRKKMLHELDLQINKFLIENFKIDTKDIEILYDKKISSIRREIKLKKQELEMYHQLFGRTYKINYKLKNRLEVEYKYQTFYNQQHEKYSIFKNTTLYKLQKQEVLLNNLNQYLEKFFSTNDEIVSQKAKQLNKAEFEILLIKNDIINIEKAIQTLKERNLELEKNINKCEENYNNKNIDLSSSIKTYIQDFAKMEDIYQVIDVKNVGQILKKYNLLKQDYNNKSYMIKIKSLDIINLNADLKKKNNEFENIITQIQKVKKDLMSKKNNEIEEILTFRISKIKFLISQVYDVLKEKISIFTQCVNNALSNIDKITESLKKSAMKSPFYSENKLTDKYNFFLSEDRKSLNVDLEKEYDEKQMLEFVIVLINSLYKFMANIIINICFYLYKKIIKEKREKQIRENAESSKSSKDIFKAKKEKENPKENFEIYLIKSEFMLNFYEKELNYTISRLNEKKKIYMRTPKEIFKQIYAEKNSKNSYNFSEFSNSLFIFPKNNGQNDTVEISTLKDSVSDSRQKKSKKEKMLLNRNQSLIAKDDFMKMYYTFYKNSLNDSKNLNKTLPKLNYSSLSSNRFSFINKFINRNVSEKLTRDKKNKKIQERIKEKSRIITAKVKEKELHAFMNKLNKNKYKNLSGIETKHEGLEGRDKDISMDQEKKEQQKRLYLLRKQLEESKKRKKYKLKSNEPEMNLISERLDDLRALDLFFSKNNKNKVIDSSVFNEYYFRIKRILSKAQNQLKESILNNESNNNSEKNSYKKVNTFIKTKQSNKKLKRYNSEYFEGNNNLKKFVGNITSKGGDESTKFKTRQSFFRLTFYNKSNKKDGIHSSFNNNLINEEDKIEEK